MAVRIFVDFDGTITEHDVGNAFFERFGGNECRRLVGEYRSGALSAVGCFAGEAEAMGEFSKDEADRFVRGQSIDRGFPAFLEFADRRGFDVTVLSDGLDYYIGEILRDHSIQDVRVYANRAEFIPGTSASAVRLTIGFPYSDSECTRCACCKRNIMVTTSGDDDVLVYIGEGFSDTCPARFADLVFAKSDLQVYCQKENISYYPYQTFDDVVRRLESLTDGGRSLPRRKRAELRRRELFRTE